MWPGRRLTTQRDLTLRGLSGDDPPVFPPKLDGTAAIRGGPYGRSKSNP
jgi:hypothetical protein